MSCNRVIDSCPGGNRRSYIATQPFSSNFFTYSEITNALSRVTIDNNLCPVGRVLRENGKKLYPGANPGINQYYVGVYDPVSLLKGFIDPNGGVFAEFNTNKPTYLDDNNSDDGSDDNSEGPDAGDPVYTKGNITAVSYNNVDSGNDNYIQLINDIDGGNAAYMGTDGAQEPYVECYTNNDSGAGRSNAYIYTYPNAAEIYASAPAVGGEAQIELNADGFVGAYASDGSIFNSGVIHPYNTCGVATLNGNTGVTVTVPAVSGPVVMLTRKSINGNVGTLTWNVVGANLTIYSTENTDVGEVSWLLLSSDN